MTDRNDHDRLKDRPPEDPKHDGHGEHDDDAPNPPHTTAHGITAPKFGSAGSGGAEFEPGLKKN